MKSRLLQIALVAVFITLVFSGQVVAKTVALSWDPSPSTVSGYKIFYHTIEAELGNAGTVEVDAQNVLTYTINDLPDEVDHFFAVSAYDASDNESTYSNVVHSPSVGTGGGTTNNAPVLATISAKTVEETSTLSFTVSATDSDGDTLIYSASNLPVGASFNATTRTFSWIPNAGQAGNYSVSFSVNDGNLSDSQNVAITVNPAGSELSAISKSGWSLHFVDSEDLASSAPFPNGRPAPQAFDGDANTMWHTQWSPSHAPIPHEIQINLGDSFTIGGFRYLPRQEGGINGTIADYEFYVSSDGSNWGSPITTGTFANNTDEKEVKFANVDARYVRLRATREVNNNSWSSMAEITLLHGTVVSGNHAPVLTPIDSQTGVENGGLNFTISATDADGDNLTFSTGTLPDGASFNASTRTFSWTPDYAQSGVYSVSFTVSDGSKTDSETVSINIADVNRAPLLAEIGTQTVGEGSALSFTISGFDPDDDGLTYNVTDLPAGANFNQVTRQFSWTPPYETTENTRIYPVTFSVTDGALSDSEIVTINVTNVNRAPVLDPIGVQNLTEGDSFNLIVVANDPDGSNLSYSATNIPAGAVFTQSTRSLSWIPTNNQSGTYQVTFTVSDGSLSDSEIVTLNVANLNQAPALDAIGSQSINEGVELVLTITASDPENSSLVLSASGLPEGASFDDAQGLFSWTPSFSQAGSFTVTFSVSDGSLSDSETVAISVVNSNQSPSISGSPATTVMANLDYQFTPTAIDPDGDSLVFSISNKPSWANFDTTTGQLSGSPTDQQVGTTSAIAIGASDGNSIVFLALFDLEVIPYLPVDSDQDGVLDHLDAFPNDGTEWLDTDNDQIGNNADTDDDNDGVSDIRDGAPLDSSKSGWVISASVGSGGFITPEGETSVLYGGSQSYTLTPMAGYQINDLLVDNVSVGAVASYQFDNVTTHHDIEAVFETTPSGLSVDPEEAGLSGVERVDAGDDSNNLVSGSPKLDLDYRFQITLRDTVAADQRKVFLLLDGYKYEMTLTSGAILTGAQYSYETRLGPAYAHSFHYSVEDSSGSQLWRYPQTGELDGPTVELLNGKNVVGTPGDINSAELTSETALNVDQAYRWVPSTKVWGSYDMVDSGSPAKAGEGYVLRRTADATLPSLDVYGEMQAATYDIEVKPGWNLIANPYKGNVLLAEVQVQHGSDSPQLWLNAAADNLVVDGVYNYLGADWGNTYAFESAAGSKSAVLTPWIGYWIYVNPTDQPVKLLISRPQQ